MSNARKLQTEIDRTLKKVDEGIELFDDIWDKVYNAGQQSLKEKYESDLKKEIKKLQRLRDQIKTWITNSEVKDKSNLMDARKLIETKMEQFKICEKDTKTKAYSKEGLARAANLGPEEQAREEKRSWLNECIDKLNELIESLEADIEKLAGGRGRVKNKNEIEKNERRIKKNQWHLRRMETIIRLLDGDEIEPSSLDSIKDDVDYYVESAPDDDGALGVEDEFDIYEDLGLDSLGSGIAATAESDVTAEAPKVIEKSPTKKKSITDTTIPGIGKVAPVKKETTPLKGAKPDTTKPTATTTPTTTPVKEKKGKDEAAVPATSWAAAMQKGTPAATPTATPDKAQPTPASSWGAQQQSNPATAATATGQTTTTTTTTAAAVVESQAQTPGVGLQGGLPAGTTTATTTATTAAATTATRPQQQPQENILSRPEIQVGLNLLNQSMKVAPFDEASGTGMSNYKPRNPHPTHRLYPTNPPVITQTVRLFEKLPIDTLFFAFYQQQGTYQQYLAAKQLRKLSWRFNKKYLTWFQRHEEPKITTKEYEQGTYVYFDYESGWCQRIKSDFKFEYQFLEDELDTKS